MFFRAGEILNAFLFLSRQGQSLHIHLGQDNFFLSLILSFSVPVWHIAHSVCSQENQLGNALSRIYSNRAWPKIRDRHSCIPFPLRLKWSDIYENSTSCISGFSCTYCQYISWNSEIFNWFSKDKRVRGYNTRVSDVVLKQNRRPKRISWQISANKYFCE